MARTFRCIIPAVAIFWLLSSVSAGAHEVMTGLKTDQIDYAYVEPKNPEHRPIYETMKEKRVLEAFQQFLSPLRLPNRITLKLEGCDGVANATFWQDAIKVCYEYVEYLRDHASKSEKWGLAFKDAMIALVVDVFLHEAGHAVFELLDIPSFGREEDAADYFSTYLLLQFSKADARRLILGTSFLAGPDSLEQQTKALRMQMVGGTHSLPGQRYFNRLCMAYGADPVLFADAITVGMLPEVRAKHCRYEYEINAHAFKILIAPYIDQARMAQVIARRWFEFGTHADQLDHPGDAAGAPLPADDAAKALLPSQQ